ncbi:MAG: penicillin-binding protein, partial [Novosphingobium sp.]
MIRRLFVWGLAFGLLAAMVIGVAVAVAYRSMPEFDELKSNQEGQTIVVRARDGTELVTLGPSYGRWLHYGDIPSVMKDAMVAVE